MIFRLAKRMLTEIEPRLLWKFAFNFGFKGMVSVERFKSRLRRGVHFPPFLYISVINSCNLKCQGCWVDVQAPRKMIDKDTLNRVIRDAKKHGNSYFGILGGEPFLHPDLLDVLDAHPDCYFQIFTNGQLITDKVAKRLNRAGNATPLISIEGTELVSDSRRGRSNVLSRTLTGLENCRKHGIITGVATSVCQTNIKDLLSEAWLRRLIDLGAHYAWFHTYRPVGPDPSFELALTPEQILQVRRFVVTMRSKLPIAIVDPYWDHNGEALCPMATGISHHIGPSGGIEPCPIIQFAKESVYDDGGVYNLLTKSAFLKDFREVSAKATQGCVVLERPDLVKQLVLKHAAADTTSRQTALAELDRMTPRNSQHNPGNEVPEEHWAYRFAKKHWFFGFGAYT
ncbi:radical SAM/SPASM domain-containing protein [Fimbriiglobus ruber]|uniref:AstB/chuR-related protein-putative enzyme of the MoaA / nifB / pqqE family n=1 Tax=Fimbriiglobus ruber TaxID=1908690 RepID=A0A225DKT9_9BACT|nr:radical SAM/SPASM domain-containing protein [Fimbriiglobus ruber]OWK36767.1 astB/chuR-related protein-putative enzyme of the MoaA / nifB / pqqE family [Fimbriiglobus ruber]